jgi:hypothetical protein
MTSCSESSVTTPSTVGFGEERLVGDDLAPSVTAVRKVARRHRFRPSD